MKISTKFVGEIEIDDKQIVLFPDGLPGFDENKKYVYIEIENSVFSCLQAIDDPNLAFITISPFLICPDYEFNLEPQVIAKLKADKPDTLLVLSFISIPAGEPNGATANLQAPVVINRVSQLGWQVIINENKYPLRQPIWNSKKKSLAIG